MAAHGEAKTEVKADMKADAKEDLHDTKLVIAEETRLKLIKSEGGGGQS